MIGCLRDPFIEEQSDSVQRLRFILLYTVRRRTRWACHTVPHGTGSLVPLPRHFVPRYDHPVPPGQQTFISSIVANASDRRIQSHIKIRRTAYCLPLTADCLPKPYSPSPSFCAILTRSATDSACILRIMFARWNLIVLSVVANSPAICLLSSPDTRKASTSRSRCVSKS